MSIPLSGPPLFGAKNIKKTGGPARWILSMLPYEKHTAYIEPYAGMLGILLNRPVSVIEIASDLNGRVTNWWRCVRDYPDELVYQINFTPHSEGMHQENYATIDTGTPVERAVKFYEVVTNSRIYADGEASKYFNLRLSTKKGRNLQATETLMAEFDALAKRMRNVQLLNREAVDILRRAESSSDTVIYCDPPYRSAVTAAYAVVKHDYEETLDTLKKQRGRVAISGYGNEWDALGWERHEMGNYSTVGVSTKDHHRRVEVLWTNYPAGAQLSMWENTNDD